MRQVEGAGEADLGLEAAVQRDHGGRDAARAGRGGEERLRHLPVAFERADAALPQHGHAGATEPEQEAEALAGERGIGAPQGPGVAPPRRAGPRRGFDDRRHFHPAVEQFHGKLQVERPAAGDQHGLAGAGALGPGE